MGALVGTDDILKTLPIDNVVTLSRNTGQWNVETRERITWSCFGGWKGKDMWTHSPKLSFDLVRGP